MKKMKGLVCLEPSLGCVDPRISFKHQSLLQDYVELEKETDDAKERLMLVKQRKFTLRSEVRFLRQRYEYLTENQSTIPQAKQASPQLQNYENRRAKLPKVKNYDKKGSDFRHSTSALDLKERKRTFNGMKASLQKTASVLDLNLKVRSINRKEATLQSCEHNFDLNQQGKMIHNRKESTKRKNPPGFDLNHISREEKELQVKCEPLRREEPKKSLLRGGNDDQQHDMKPLACRNSGSNRAGKRKISWQDQVALRV